MLRRTGLVILGTMLIASALQGQDESMPGMEGMEMGSPHMTLTPVWPERAGDRARADSIVSVARAFASRYTDVAQAEADGYKRFAPEIKHQRIYHYTSTVAALKARFTFDASRPTAILYTDDGHGGLRLTGVMYTMPAGASLTDLDDRIPLSVARWHEHTNICLPPRGQERLLEAGAGDFGARGRISTREACEAAGGRFRERLFGWMVHVNLAADSPAEAFNDDHVGMRPH